MPMKASRVVCAVGIAVLAPLSSGCGTEKRSQYAFRGRLLRVPYRVTILGERGFSEVSLVNDTAAQVPFPIAQDGAPVSVNPQIDVNFRLQ